MRNFELRSKVPESEQVPITEKSEKEFDALNEKGKKLVDKEELREDAILLQ